MEITIKHSRFLATYEADELTFSHEKVDHNIWNILAAITFDGWEKEFRFFCNNRALIAEIEELENSKIGMSEDESDEIENHYKFEKYFANLSASEMDELHDYCDELATWPEEEKADTPFNPIGYSLIPSNIYINQSRGQY